MRRFSHFAATTILAALAVTACSDSGTEPVTGGEQPPADSSSATAGAATATSGKTGGSTATPGPTGGLSDHDDPADYTWDDSKVIAITLNGSSASAANQAVKTDGSTVTITAAGSYRISGKLSDGQVVVDTDDDEVVRLILSGADIANADGAAIAVLDAKKVMVVLAEKTENRLSDGKEYALPSADTDEPNAALFSTADLTLTGAGSLTVSGKYNDGIASKDGLVISGGTITVEAADDGLRGKDYVVLKSGSLTIKAAGDGVKADNEEDATLGYVTIAGGTLKITSGRDGIDAATAATVTGGDLSIASGGGATATPAADASAKAIKGTASVAISGGTFAIDSADDAIHSNENVTIDGGTFTIATGDDGVHADTTLVVNGGKVTITRSYEGLESAAITISGGEISLVSSDDGINAAGGRDASGVQAPGRPGAPDAFGGAAGAYSTTINGGTILVSASGDGLDINGKLAMSGGLLVVQGPTANNNGALDFDGGFALTGGTLIAAGSAGMAQAPGTGSTQASVHVRFGTAQAAGTLVSILDGDGKAIVTFKAAKAIQSLVVSTPSLTEGTTYDVKVGGSVSGESLNGYYEGGTSSGGSASGTVTAQLVWQSMGGFGGR
jgi:hypothetical protein